MHDNVSLVDREHSVSPYSLPNALTVICLLLVSVFVWLMVSELPGARWWVVLALIIVASTDQLDGHTAHLQSLVTDFGKLADLIADKTLTLGAFVMLTVIDLLPWWVTTLVAFHELGITRLRAILLKRGIIVAASKGGRLKTVLQIFAIWVLLIPWATIEFGGEWSGLFAQGMLVSGWTVADLVLVVTLWSGWVYMAEGMRLKKDAKTQS